MMKENDAILAIIIFILIAICRPSIVMILGIMLILLICCLWQNRRKGRK